MPKPIVYTLPGLGFDHRLFGRLRLPDYEVHHLDWLEPQADESIASYAVRMAEKMAHPPSQCILVGHSFGGILAQEMAARSLFQKVVLVSSIKSAQEKPLNFKMIAPLGLHHFFTKRITLNTFPYWGKYFGYETPEVQLLFKKMVVERSDRYLRWALLQLSRWADEKMDEVPVYHIHGDLDKTFPVRLIAQPVQLLPGGTHMMIYSRAEEVSNMIHRAIHEE